MGITFLPSDKRTIIKVGDGTVETGLLAPNCEYHVNLDAAQAAAGGELSREVQSRLFDRIDWLKGLAENCLPDMVPLVVEARVGGAALWLPLMRGGAGRLDSLANWYNFSWAPVWVGNPQPIERMALLRAAAQGLARRAHRIVLHPVPDEDGSAQEIADAFAIVGWQVAKVESDTNHILHVGGRSFDAYWQGRPGRLRSTVKRKGKTGQVALRIDRTFDPDSWADYESVYSRSWKPAEGNPDFLRALARTEGAAGTLRLGLAYIDGKPVAAQFWTVENGVALIHKLAHDEAYLAASPGTLLSAALFQHVIDTDHVDLIDFGTGADAYKADWMEEQRPRYRLDMLRADRPRAWPALAKRLAKKLAATHNAD